MVDFALHKMLVAFEQLLEVYVLHQLVVAFALLSLTLQSLFLKSHLSLLGGLGVETYGVEDNHLQDKRVFFEQTHTQVVFEFAHIEETHHHHIDDSEVFEPLCGELGCMLLIGIEQTLIVFGSVFPIEKLQTVDFVGPQSHLALELPHAVEEVLVFLDPAGRQVFLQELSVEEEREIAQNVLSQLECLV